MYRFSIENTFIKRVFLTRIIEFFYCTVKYFFNKFNKLLLILVKVPLILLKFTEHNRMLR